MPPDWLISTDHEESEGLRGQSGGNLEREGQRALGSWMHALSQRGPTGHGRPPQMPFQMNFWVRTTCLLLPLIQMESCRETWPQCLCLCEPPKCCLLGGLCSKPKGSGLWGMESSGPLTESQTTSSERALLRPGRSFSSSLEFTWRKKSMYSEKTWKSHKKYKDADGNLASPFYRRGGPLLMLPHIFL